MSELIPRVGVSTVASPMEVGADRAGPAQSDLVALLRGNGVEVIPSESAVMNPDAAVAAGRRFAEAHVDAICIGAASWFEDYLVLDMLEEADVPVLMWPLPGMETGALCGTQQLTAYLKQLRRPYASVFGAMEPGESLTRGLRYLRAASLKARLRRARIGLAGCRVPGMTEVAVNEFAMKRALGPRMVVVDMAGLIQRAQAADRDEKEKVWQRVKGAAARVEVPDEAGLDSAGMYLAIREVVREHALSAFTFGCYPDMMGSACVAASLLADEGIPVGCEGDVNGSVGMLMLWLLTGTPTHNTDWLDPLPDGTVVFTHCGSGSYSLAAKPEEIAVAPVRLAHAGACSLFTARPGPVTLVSLMPLGSGYQIACMEGEALEGEMVFPGNPLRVRFEKPVQDIVDWIHAEGIGHHWMAGYGHVAAEIGDLAGIIGSDVRLLNL